MAYEYTPSKFMLPTSRYDKTKADRAVTFIQNLCKPKGSGPGPRSCSSLGRSRSCGTSSAL